MDTINPFLYFNFAQQDGARKSIYFTNPIKVCIAYTIQDVIPCLQFIQEQVVNGYYAAGYLSYESAPAFNPNLPVQTNYEMPFLWFGLFKEPSNGNKVDVNQQTYTFSDWKPNIPLDKYYKNIRKIKQYIRIKQTEQVNYTIRLGAKFAGNSFAYFKQLERTQANYNAYLNIGDFSILSASPELFFRKKGDVITTKPMKGTIHRGNTFEQDIQNAKWLQSSAKNRYENELIIQLMCNELEKIAQKETINVSDKFTIEKYPTVYQMTSTIQAKLQPNKNIVDIFKALFPCGSITGTPKKETMDIIRQLEEKPREVYCGAIGYFTPYNEAIFNVPIRTVVINHQNNNAQFGVGGAITIDSNEQEEYQEILTKAKLLSDQRPTFQLLESFGLKNGKYIVYTNHIKRLKQSADYFNFDIDLDQIKKELNLIAKKYQVGYWKIRLRVSKEGKFSIDVNKISQNVNQAKVTLAHKPMTKNNIFLYHKTTYRDMYDEYREGDHKFFDVLLWNEEKEVTEFTTGNIVVEIEGELVTPPIECGLLPGTFRDMLLQNKVIKEQKVTVEELKLNPNIWFINSVREWVPVILNI